MNDLIRQVTRINHLTVPKDQFDQSWVTSAFGNVIAESPDSWLVPCSHTLNAPATNDEIAATEQALGHPIPDQYKQFLKISNGAKLFIVPVTGEYGGVPWVRHHLSSCQELSTFNQFALKTFLEVYANDPEYNNVRALNYMAYCDAQNDNYQSIVLNGPRAGQVFLLFNEFQCRPYSEIDSDFYYTIAESFELWLELLIQSGGWDGRGEQSGGL